VADSESKEYTDTKSEVVNLNETDPEFVKEIVKAGGENVYACYQCGTCTAGCPAGWKTGYKVRSILRKSVLGLKQEVISDPVIWNCTTCYICQDRCPRDVQPTEVIKTIRNLAVKGGHMQGPHKNVAHITLKLGHAVPINDQFADLRKALGLERLPPNASSSEKARKEIRKIAKRTGFADLVDFEEEEESE